MSEFRQTAGQNGFIDSEPLPGYVNDSGNFEYHKYRVSRIEALVHIFADKSFAPSAYEAIKLLEPTNDLFDERVEHQKNAANAIDAYFSSPDCKVESQDKKYVESLLGDIPTIKHSAANYEARLEALADESPSGRAKEVLGVLHGESDIPQEYWDHLRFGVDLPDTTRLAEKANVEAVIIMAAAALERLISSEKGSAEQLRTILEIETFYAPLVDALGLSAFDMTLRNEANKARLVAGGHEDLVTQARADLAGAEDAFEPAMEAFFGQVEESPDFQINTCMLHGDLICFGERNIENLTKNAWRGRLIERVKTIGSIAHKRLHNKKYRDHLPQDVIGMTAVMDSAAEMADFFNYVYDVVSRSENMNLKGSPSKEGKAVSIQGTQEYIERVMSHLGEGAAVFAHTPEEPSTKKVEDTFQVLKVTFDIIMDDGREIPVEFQFQTHIDRYNSRLGGASHIHYKGIADEENAHALSKLLGNVPGRPSDLETINRRQEAFYAINPNTTIYIDNESGEHFRAAWSRARRLTQAQD